MSERLTNHNIKLTADYQYAVDNNLDQWVPACGGNEMPLIHKNQRWLYVYNPATGKHGYLNLDTDIVYQTPPWYN